MNEKEERRCSVCHSNITGIRKRNGKVTPHWYKLENKDICCSCYMRLIYSKTENGKDTHKRTSKKWGLNNSDKVKAHNISNYQHLKLDHCEKCGIKNVRLEGHHFDYSQPDKIITLCVKCHKEVHNGKD